jgi:hypothetical protein
MRSLVLLTMGALIPVAFGEAHDVITTNLTYSRDISRIFVHRCVTCHDAKDGIPLTSYREVRPWAVDIKEQVLSRQMPPWGAVKGFGDLAPDGGLTQEELLIVAAWVVGGAPEGDPATLPQNTAPDPKKETPALRDALLVDGSTRLAAGLVLAGIRPAPSTPVASARIIANLPDGRKQPLLWLFQFDPKWKQVFRFRAPLELPAGTVVTSDAPLRFALETK